MPRRPFSLEHNLAWIADRERKKQGIHMTESQKKINKVVKRRRNDIFLKIIPVEDQDNPAYDLNIPRSGLSHKKRKLRDVLMDKADNKAKQELIEKKCAICNQYGECWKCCKKAKIENTINLPITTSILSTLSDVNKEGKKNKDKENKESKMVGKCKKKSSKICNISQRLRDQVWSNYTSLYKTVCFCCNRTEITALNFEAGHVIARSKGGTLSAANLRPICAACNRSMGQRNMHEFQKEIYPDVYNKGSLSHPIKVEEQT